MTTVPAVPPVPPVRADLPATLQVGEPVVYRMKGLAAEGDNLCRMAFVTRLYRRPIEAAEGGRPAADLLVLTGSAQAPLLAAVDVAYDPVRMAAETFARNTGAPGELLTVAALMNAQTDPTVPAKL